MKPAATPLNLKKALHVPAGEPGDGLRASAPGAADLPRPGAVAGVLEQFIFVGG